MCSFFSRQCMNLWVPERQITKSTKSQIKLDVELKRRTSQANRSITIYKDIDTSLWRTRQNYFLNELHRG